MQPIQALQVVGVRYRGSTVAETYEKALAGFGAANVYASLGVPVEIVEPAFPAAQQVADEPTNLGIFGGLIADEVAAARRQGKALLLVGGNCAHMTGVVGGLQDVHGPGARIGLVWFDAHGDFNTPRTTLSGMLGGMPVAVSAGLAYPDWRTASHIVAPLPTDRIVMVDVRNLDVPEAQLIHATDVTIAAVAHGFPGAELSAAVNDLAARCDLLYLHIDADILDAAYVPNHNTREPNGPNMAQVQAAIHTVMATGKVAALAVVSVYGTGEGNERCIASGCDLIQSGLTAWRQSGMG
jgi:arginase